MIRSGEEIGSDTRGLSKRLGRESPPARLAQWLEP